jgi:sortase A
MGVRARRLRRPAVACLLCLGFWPFGEGAYVPAEAWLAQEFMQRTWIGPEAGATMPAAWPWAHTWPIARLSAKAGAVDLIVLAGGSRRTLAFGPGHLSASSLPGARGTVVIAGHANTHFRFLRDVEIGESVFVETVPGHRYEYVISGIDVVDSRRGSLVLDTERSMLTLVTSYPFEARAAAGTLRYVVTAELLP